MLTSSLVPLCIASLYLGAWGSLRPNLLKPRTRSNVAETFCVTTQTMEFRAASTKPYYYATVNIQRRDKGKGRVQTHQGAGSQERVTKTRRLEYCRRPVSATQTGRTQSRTASAPSPDSIGQVHQARRNSLPVLDMETTTRTRMRAGDQRGSAVLQSQTRQDLRGAPRPPRAPTGRAGAPWC